MAHYKYFILTNSNSSLSKKFRVILTSYNATLEKSQTISKTLDGNLDVSVGGIYETHQYAIRVKQTEDEEDYGSLNDLETFFMLNDPNGTPSNVLTLTDHYGVDYSVYYVGNFSKAIMGVSIEGENAWFVVQAAFQFIGLAPEGYS